MPSDILIGDCRYVATVPLGPDPDITLESISPRHLPALAECYLASYPSGIGATSIADSIAEMEATFDSEYGVLYPPASPTAVSQGRVVGSAMTVHRSPWDPHLTCPFVIELFVHPDVRGQSLGRRLLREVASSCLRIDQRHFALRTGPGTSAAAFRLYESLGMEPS